MDFCEMFEQLYGKEHCTINIHLHGHLKECMLDFGPVYGFILSVWDSWARQLGMRSMWTEKLNDIVYIDNSLLYLVTNPCFLSCLSIKVCLIRVNELFCFSYALFIIQQLQPFLSYEVCWALLYHEYWSIIILPHEVKKWAKHLGIRLGSYRLCLV